MDSAMFLPPPMPPGPHGGKLTVHPAEPTGEVRKIPARRRPIYFLFFVVGYEEIPAREEPVIDNRVSERWVEGGRQMGAWWWLADFRRLYGHLYGLGD